MLSSTKVSYRFLSAYKNMCFISALFSTLFSDPVLHSLCDTHTSWIENELSEKARTRKNPGVWYESWPGLNLIMWMFLHR